MHPARPDERRDQQLSEPPVIVLPWSLLAVLLVVWFAFWAAVGLVLGAE